jgi:hypothetical protein
MGLKLNPDPIGHLGGGRGLKAVGGAARSIVDGITAAWFLNEDSGARYDSNGVNHLTDPASTGTANGHAVFVAASKNYLTMDSNAAITLGTDVSFTITLKCKPAAVSGLYFVFGKGDQTAYGYEYSIYIQAGQAKLKVNGSGTTAVTVTDAVHTMSIGGTYQITAGYNSATQKVSIKVDNNAPVEADWTTGTKSINNKLSIGRHGNVDGSYYGGEVWDVVFWRDRYLTAAEQSLIFGLSYPFGYAPYLVSAAQPTDLSNQYAWHDFSDVTHLFTDAAKTTPVAADADPISVASNKFTGTHDLTADSDAVRPVYKTGIQNSLGAGLWNGTDSNLVIPEWPDADYSVFIVARNSDAANGSDLLFQGALTRYLVVTGASYDATSPRAVLHTGTNGATAVNAVSRNFAALTNCIVEIRKSGTTYTCWINGDYATATQAGPSVFTDIGKESVAGLWLDGYVMEMVKYSSALSNTDHARIRAGLAAKWAVTPVYYNPFVLA